MFDTILKDDFLYSCSTDNLAMIPPQNIDIHNKYIFFFCKKQDPSTIRTAKKRFYSVIVNSETYMIKLPFIKNVLFAVKMLRHS